jgi:predicted alpha/beta-fold hydrolase
MAHCKSQENSSCEDFQSVVLHTAECNTNLLSDINNLSNQVNATFQQIKNKSEKSRIVYDNVLTSFTDQRTQELEQIEQIYENHLQRIESQQEALNIFHRELLKYLKDNATQHLERVQRQHNSNTEVLNRVRQTIEKVQNDGAHLKCNFSIPLLNDIEFSSSAFPHIPIPVPQSTMSRIDKEKQSIF